MHDKQVSVVISARNEFPNIVHTVHSIVNDLETFLTPEQWEIIIVDNCSDDDKQTWRYLAMRGMYAHGNLRVLHDPIAGNVTARNKGAKIAKGKYLFFSDAHMSYKIGSFKAMVKAIDESGGIVHPAVEWMGGYLPSDPSYQYSIKLGEKIWGTWNKLKVADTWFYIPMSGHCCLGMRRDQFLEFGGYNPYFRCYGGGEFYLDTKWWLLGSSSVCEPNAMVYHLSAGRGYSYIYDDFIHNMMLLAFALGGEAWAERVYIRYLSKGGAREDVVTELYEQAREESEWTSNNVEGFGEVKLKGAHDFDWFLDERPFDKKNDERHGRSISGILIFDETWLKGVEGRAQEIYRTSKLQMDLREKIQKKWGHLVYKGAET